MNVKKIKRVYTALWSDERGICSISETAGTEEEENSEVVAVSGVHNLVCPKGGQQGKPEHI